MAKITGAIKVKGTLDDVCFYERNGRYYARSRPGADRKQFLKGKRYAVQREASFRMNKGNKIASLIYRHLLKEKRVYTINVELQRRAAGLLKQGISVAKVTISLCQWAVQEGYLVREQALALPGLANALDFSACIPGSGKRKDIDHFKGVRVRTVEGRWLRIYHRDEWELLEEYTEQMEKGDEWVEAFLLRRKGLATYRLKHRYKRRYQNKDKKDKKDKMDKKDVVVREKGTYHTNSVRSKGMRAVPLVFSYPEIGFTAKHKRKRRDREDERRLVLPVRKKELWGVLEDSS